MTDAPPLLQRLASLRREHYSEAEGTCETSLGDPCTCGADSHNATLDECIAEVRDALRDADRRLVFVANHLERMTTGNLGHRRGQALGECRQGRRDLAEALRDAGNCSHGNTLSLAKDGPCGYRRVTA